MRPRHRLCVSAAAAAGALLVSLLPPSAPVGAASRSLRVPSAVMATGDPLASMCPSPRGGALFDSPSIGSKKTVALTFDDGPGGSTQAIIGILERFHVRATFFNIGVNIGERPDLVREEARDGFLLGNHSVTHPDLETLSPGQQAYQMDGVARMQRALVQTAPCVFRPPYGAYDATTLSLANERRMAVWMWNNSGGDWEARGSGSAYWVRRIISAAEGVGLNQQHPTVLLHNQPILMPATVAALPSIITFFQQHGFTFEDLLGRTGPPGTCGPSSAAAAHVANRSLAPGDSLRPGETLRSPGGQFVLTMRHDGNLVLTLATGRVLWSTNTSSAGSTATVEATGDFVVRSSGGTVKWSSGTGGHPGARYELQVDGTQRMVSGTTSLWSTKTAVSQLLAGERLKSSWRITSPNGLCRLVQQPSGPLTLQTASGQTLWNSETTGSAGATTVLLANGNFVVVHPAGTTVWQSFTASHKGARLRITDQGVLVISASTGTPLWATQ